MKYVVIGSQGFLGKAVSDLISRENRGFLIKIDKAISKDYAGSKNVYNYQVDLTDSDRLIEICRSQKVDIVINLAGTIGESSDEKMFELNCFAPIDFVKAAKGQRFKVVLIGSAAEYGEIPYGVKADETFDLSPVSGYGISKAAQT